MLAFCLRPAIMRRRMRQRFLLLIMVLLVLPASASARTIQFSGHTWEVRASNGLAGPGPNIFSGATKSVWVDSTGALHLKIRKEKGKWLSAEVFSQQFLGPFHGQQPQPPRGPGAVQLQQRHERDRRRGRPLEQPVRPDERAVHRAAVLP